MQESGVTRLWEVARFGFLLPRNLIKTCVCGCSTCLSAHLCVCVDVVLHICVSVCVCVCVCMCGCRSTHLCVCLSVCVCMCLYVWMSFYTSLCVLSGVSRLVSNTSSSSLGPVGDQSDDDRGIEFEANCMSLALLSLMFSTYLHYNAYLPCVRKDDG